MKIFSKSLGLAAVAVAATLTLSACTGSSDTEVPDTATEVEVVETPTDEMEGESETDAPVTPPDVEIDPEIEELLNPGEGQAIVPGSIPTETQEDLSATCEEAVTPIRDIMESVSGLAATPDQLAEAGDLRANAEEVCDPQEYADWYTKEFVGWLYQE